MDTDHAATVSRIAASIAGGLADDVKAIAARTERDSAWQDHLEPSGR